MSLNRKRKAADISLDQTNDQQQKRTNELCSNEVRRSSDMVEVVINKMTPKERELVTNLFKFPVISNNQMCQICDLDITRSARVICGECKSFEKNTIPFIFCVECLRKGKEKETHKRDHSYSILDRMDFPLFDEEWTAQDDVTLLKGISQSGIDNWVEISEQLGLKTPNDCENHFYSFYYKSQEDPIPRIEEVVTLKRDPTTCMPIIKDSVLKAGKKKKQKFIEDKKKGGKQETQANGRKHKEDENSDDQSKKQGKKSGCILFTKLLELQL